MAQELYVALSFSNMEILDGELCMHEYEDVFMGLVGIFEGPQEAEKAYVEYELNLLRTEMNWSIKDFTDEQVFELAVENEIQFDRKIMNSVVR